MPRGAAPVRASIGVLLVVTIVLGGALLLRSRDDGASDGWRDCTAPRVQSTPPVESTEEVDVSLTSVAEIPDVVALLDTGSRMLVATMSGQVVDLESVAVVSDEEGELNLLAFPADGSVLRIDPA